MNIRRIAFWVGFFAVLALVIWGLVVAMGRTPSSSLRQATVAADDHVLGNASAPITIIEYSDFQCPACRQSFYLMERLLNESSTTVRFIYRHFPLSQHPNAMKASLASEAAGIQGKFWDMYRELFLNYAEWTEEKNPNELFTGYASKIGLDIEQFTEDVASSTLKRFITDQQDQGIRLGVNATPTFFVNGQAVIANQDYDQFKAAIYATAQTSNQ